MFSIDLKWLSFNVSLDSIETWMRANAGDKYAGNAADHDLTVWFSEEPSDDIKAAIAAYWAGLTEDSAEATAYKTAEQISAEQAIDKAAKIASATTKLEAIGLTADEIAALRG